MSISIKIAIVIALCLIGWLIARSFKSETEERTRQEVPEPVETYKDLRSQIFNTTAEEYEITTSSETEIYAVLMETGYPESVVTLVAILDGNSSIYFGNGGGVIGGIDHKNVREESVKMVTMANDFKRTTRPTDSYPLPNVGETTFYLLSPQQVFTATEVENKLGEGKHDLSPLFYQGHEVISQLRKIDDN